MTAKDVGLMLRMGYSSNAIEQELATRHFADQLDDAKETELLKAGAQPDLVNALKSGAYSLSPTEIARAKQQLEEQAKRRAWQAEQARKFDTLYQDKLAQERAAGRTEASHTSEFYNYFKDDLVRPANGSLVHADGEALSRKKWILFYFSAHWCGPCRKFTPQLVDYYNRVAPQHPEFEVVFYSFDKTAAAMESYMRETNMPWPAIDYEKRENKSNLRRSAGDGIPSLVLVDQTGKVVSSAYDGTRYVGPDKVLSDLDSIFAGNGLPKIAQTQ